MRNQVIALGLSVLIAPAALAQDVTVVDDAGASFRLLDDGSYGRLARDADGATYLLRADGSWEQASRDDDEGAEPEEVRELEAVSPDDLEGEELNAALSEAVEAHVARAVPDADEAERGASVQCLIDLFDPLAESEKRMLVGQPTLDAALDLWADEGQPEARDEMDREMATCLG